MDLDSVEGRRQSLQKQLDDAKSQEERNQNGQFATPPELARQLVDFACTLLPEGDQVDFLEPAVGTGPFLTAFFETVADREIGRVHGIEKDGGYAEAAREVWTNAAVQIRQADFTKLDPPATEEERFDLLVTNPPYVRHHHLSGQEKNRLRRRTRDILGTSPSGYTGLYCYFVYLAHEWLREGGVGGWLVPTEFTEVGYGTDLRDYLLDQVTLLRVHQYRPDDLQFESALVSSCVVWYRKETPQGEYDVEFSFGGTHRNPERVLSLRSTALADLQKWNLLSLDGGVKDRDHPKLGDVFDISRGVATGDNDFFILEEEEKERLALPDQFLQPILPSPRYLDQTIIETNDDGTPDLDKRLWLLSCDLKESTVRERYPHLWAYLERGKETGVHERYLCRNRRVWFHQEHREPAPFLCKYMGREELDFFLNRSEAIASNNLTMMYPNALLQAALQTDPTFEEKLILLLSEVSEEAMRQGGRTYGGGMTKIEPGELEDIPVPGLQELLSEAEEGLGKQLEETGSTPLF